VVQADWWQSVVKMPEKTHGSEKQRRDSEPRFLVIGKVLGAHGVGGELKVQVISEDPHRFGRMEQVFIGLEDDEPEPRALERFRLHKGNALLKLLGCDDRGTASSLRDYLLQVPIEDAIPLEEGEYYEFQILGLEVWTVSGEHLGKVVEVLATGANDVYVVHGTYPGHREILVPALESVVLEIDLEGGRMVVELPEGLL
jgi:16S rRNA processing protein RimM